MTRIIDLTKTYGLQKLNSPDETYLHISFRHTNAALEELLVNYLYQQKEILEDFSKGSDAALLHNDFFRTARIQRLKPKYRVELTGTARDRLISTSLIAILSGQLTITSIDPVSEKRKTQVITPGQKCTIHDNETHIIETTADTEVLQIASPGKHRGRTLMLPLDSPHSCIRETFLPEQEIYKKARRALGPATRYRCHSQTPMSSFVDLARRVKKSKKENLAQKYAGLRVMFVHAHPDDESSKGAATEAMLAAEGAQVLVVTCTGGEQGSALNPAFEQLEPHQDLLDIRRWEMERARKELGIEHRWLGFIDSGMPDDHLPPLGSFAANADAAETCLIGVVREFKPHVVVIYGEDGGYSHLDHETVYRIGEAAFENAGDPSLSSAGNTEPWQPIKLYFQKPFHSQNVRVAHEYLTASGRESPFDQLLGHWAKNPEQDPLFRVTTRIESSRYFGHRRRALLSHESQVDPHTPWLSIPDSIHQQYLPTEDFELAQSWVWPKTPETDLFAGVREYCQRNAQNPVRLQPYIKPRMRKIKPQHPISANSK